MIGTHGVDLAVLGTRGYSKTKGFFLGSVSQRVLQEAPCSVLIGRKTSLRPKRTRGMNLLLATDGSFDAKAALSFGKELRFPPGSQLTILHVVRGSVSQAEPLWATYGTQQAKWLRLSQELQTIRRREG